MNIEEQLLFDSAPKTLLMQFLRKRGIFLRATRTKEELRQFFGYGFSFEEYKQLKEHHEKEREH